MYEMGRFMACSMMLSAPVRARALPCDSGAMSCCGCFPACIQLSELMRPPRLSLEMQYEVSHIYTDLTVKLSSLLLPLQIAVMLHVGSQLQPLLVFSNAQFYRLSLLSTGAHGLVNSTSALSLSLSHKDDT